LDTTTRADPREAGKIEEGIVIRSRKVYAVDVKPQVTFVTEKGIVVVVNVTLAYATWVIRGGRCWAWV